jgi:hypothetical protein
MSYSRVKLKVYVASSYWLDGLISTLGVLSGGRIPTIGRVRKSIRSSKAANVLYMRQMIMAFTTYSQNQGHAAILTEPL